MHHVCYNKAMNRTSLFRCFLLTLPLLLLSGCLTPSPFQNAPCVWEEHFDGTALDRKIWTPETDFVRNIDAAQIYKDRPENLRVADGSLQLTARHEYAENSRYDATSPNWLLNRKSADYTSGSVNSQGKLEFRYGRLEIRARIEHGTGVWPALWLIGSRRGWPDCGEIDILEYISQTPDRAHATFHFSQNGAYIHPTDSTICKTLDGDWHLYGMDWTPERIVLTLDGQPVNTLELDQATSADGSNPFRDLTFFLILNQAIDGWSETPNPQDYPKTFRIDSIRLWQNPNIPGTVLLRADCPPSATFQK